MDNGLTKRQIEILILVAPHPMGRGLTHEQAANYLKITPKVINKIIHTIKNRCPKAWDALKIARRRAAETRLQLQKTGQLNPHNELRIKEQF